MIVKKKTQCRELYQKFLKYLMKYSQEIIILNKLIKTIQMAYLTQTSCSYAGGFSSALFWYLYAFNII